MSAPDALQFVETNGLVHAHDSSAAPEHSRALELARELWSRGDGCLSVRVVQELHVTVMRHDYAGDP